MTVEFVAGDLFLSRAQTIAHGCNCRGRMGAGVALEIKRRFPEVYAEYRARCHRGELVPGGVYLETATTPWILNLATQADTGGAQIEHIRSCIGWIVDNAAREGITSLAMPRIGAGLGGLEWAEVRRIIEERLGASPLPVIVYDAFVEGHQAVERSIQASAEGAGPVLFFGRRHPAYALHSNFASTPIEIDGTMYPTVEHFYQASKAVTVEDHERIRQLSKPKKALKAGRSLERIRPDWDEVKTDVMRRGLLAKFTQNTDARALLLSTRDRAIHEDNPSDSEWGWLGGEGNDLLGQLLMEIREVLRSGES